MDIIAITRSTRPTTTCASRQTAGANRHDAHSHQTLCLDNLRHRL